MHSIHMSSKSAANTAYVLTTTKTYLDIQLSYVAHYEAALRSSSPLHVDKENSARQLKKYNAQARQLKKRIDRDMLSHARRQEREEMLSTLSRYLSLQPLFCRKRGAKVTQSA
ncbi:hypothetical protein HWV62_7388 [Athelia sp. TMB]|nr:hypothetical protein HWV62_22205 [Athelia sp. TMB]KAF7976204.1 hypothetical protein HWV62_7388 [Athelia sp. TMB]